MASTPRIRIVPPVASSSPATHRSSDVLPHPLGPTTTVTPPRGQSMRTRSSATCVPYRLVSPSTASPLAAAPTRRPRAWP
ncbi:hypothetical protein BJF78_02395 [Pseudonocardia sp. CNS-139]|nr:hypothetical protein BJF78_02395 [Pseudonocardia sp. CNS-139]